ncbi:MAG: hypothetical protein JRF72_22210, partial [Deltaproteobacteria bacterium]|nr:hypothetical protein [Deltaproteobacteria bacterium]
MQPRLDHIIITAFIGSVCLVLSLATPVWANLLSSATIEVRVSQGDDDAEEDVINNSMDLSSSDLELVHESNDQIIGIRFQNVMIPHKSTITNAYILFTTDETDSEPTSLTIWGEDVDDAKIYENIDKNISDRNKTSASVVWNDIPAWGTVGETGVKQQTPDLTAIVQEIVNRGGWDSGKAMAFIIEGTGKRVAESYNGSSSKAPLLHVEFTSNVVDVWVKESSDDAEQRTDLAGDNMYLYSSDLDLRQDRLSGMRFDKVQVPQGAEITAAYIEFTVWGTHTGNARVTIDVEMHDNPPTFYDVPDNISNRTLSGNYVEWDPIAPWDTSGEKQRTPDISSLVQQIVGRPGWASDNAMVFVIEGLQWNRSAATYDADPGLAPRLHIEYGEGEIGTDEPIITLDREYLGATTLETSNPASASINLSNTGTGKLVYLISDTATWLSVSPASGDLLEGAEQIIKVNYNTASLAPGTYEATITISDANAINNPVEIQVSVTIEPIPEDLSCGNIPVYTENLVSPAILILLDVSGSMKTKMEVAPEVKPRTPGLIEIVQEIVDRPGWASGNAMAFIIEGPGRRTAVAYDQDSAKAPLLHVEYNDGIAKVLDVRVNQDSDDAEERMGGTSVNITSADLEMSWDNGDPGKAQIIGLRFQNVTIPRGAVITNAYIQFEIDETDDAVTGLIIWGEDMDNPPTFANTDNNISGRSKTMASVVWNPIEKWTGVTKERRIDIGKSVISDLVKDRAISWGFGTWCSKNPWKEVSDGSFTLVHEGTKPNTYEHQAALQAAIAGIEPNGGTPFSFSIEGATNYFEGNKKDKDETGDVYLDVDCQPKFLIEITDGQGNTGSSKDNTNTRTNVLADAGVTGVGVGFGLDIDQAEQLYEMAKVANERGAASETDDIYALHEEIGNEAEPFFANSKQDLVRALAEITESVKGAIFHGSAPAPTTSADLGDTVIVAKFDASRWTGDVEAVTKDANGLWIDVEWAASEEMPAARSIWTVDTDGKTVINFTDATLASDNFACFNSKPIGDIINSTPVVVGRPPFYYPYSNYSKFLRDTYRDTMIYIGANDGSLHAIDLATGQEQWAFVPPSMHNKLNQAELDPLYDRCAPEYCHQYYVDGSPIVADVFDYFGGASEEWRTVLVIGEREGGEAYFALDVTSGKSFSDGDPAKYLWEFTDDELGQTWADPGIERVAVDGSITDTAWGVYFGSGYFGNPVLQATKEAYLYGIHANDASPLWKDKDSMPTNRIKMSYNSTGTIAYDNWVSSFFDPNQVGETVTGATSGATGTIVDVNIITLYSSGTIDLKDITGTFIDNEVLTSSGGGKALVNGALTGGAAMMNDALASPLVVDMEADYIADRIYAGNLYGNMFRVMNIGENMTPQVGALFSFENISPSTNPIRAKASYAFTEDDDEIWVYFGTGRYEGMGDKTSTSQQYFMGLKDSTTPVPTYYPDDLLTLKAKFKTVNIGGKDITVRYVEGANTDPPQSWKMQLDLGQQAWGGPPAAGSERVITQPLVVGGIVFFTTFIPDENICAGAGETWVFALDYNSG